MSVVCLQLLSTDKYTSAVLYVTWRTYITKYLHRHYFKNDLYYRINVLDGKIDNP